MAERYFNSLAASQISDARKAGEKVVERKFQGRSIFEDTLEALTSDCEQDETGRICISSDVEFYSVKALAKKTGWSIKAVQLMFNMPDFPYLEFGKGKLVLNHALIQYCSVRRDRKQIEKMRKEEM